MEPSATEGAVSGRAADSVVSALQARIMSGDLPDSRPLPAERALMEEFGASRTVIREAISTLSSRGLLESRPRFRPIVRKPDYRTVLNAAGNVVQHMMNRREGVKNLYDSRVFIERALVREAALSASKHDVTALKEALAANQAAIANSLAFYQTDTAFHGVLYRIPGNPIFPAIHAGFTSWLAPHWEKMPRSPERNEVNFRAHNAIVDGILDRDPAAAETALRDHLGAAWQYVRVTFNLEDA